MVWVPVVINEINLCKTLTSNKQHAMYNDMEPIQIWPRLWKLHAIVSNRLAGT